MPVLRSGIQTKETTRPPKQKSVNPTNNQLDTSASATDPSEHMPIIADPSNSDKIHIQEVCHPEEKSEVASVELAT
jgi:hypothetical protein